MNISIFNQIN